MSKDPHATKPPDTPGDLHGSGDTSADSYALLDEKLQRVYLKFYQETYKAKSEGLDRKTKELIAIAAALIAGGKNCLEGHLRKAAECGASRQELSETLAVAAGVAAATVVDRSDIAAAEIDLDGLLDTKPHLPHTAEG